MKYALAISIFGLLLFGCSTKNNTQQARMYHELNTRYNVYFNANEAYKKNLESDINGRQDNLSKLLAVYPMDVDLNEEKTPGGSYDVTVDKTTKAIKLHSITAKPKRDPSKKQNKEYQLWLQQQEFNPFLKNAWLLLGKGEYQNKDYLLASSTFSYVIRLYRTNPDVVMEARIWLAKCYLAMGWYYEAEDIFHNIGLEGGVSADYEDLYNEIYADLLIKKKEYEQAIPYLEKAIKGTTGKQKLRLKYLLGQVYALLGEKEKAFQAFQDVQGMNTPYEFTFNAKIQQAAFVNDANRKDVLAELNRMTKNSKNKDYLDQVHYAIGNIYLGQQDSTQAIESYKKAIKESTRNGYDKAVAEVLLGDIYFNQNKYIDAQPAYSGALSNLDKKEEAYSRVEHRSAVLDELVVYLKAIHLQDSLQTLAQMPEDKRLEAINKVITAVKEKEKEEKRLQQQVEGNNNQPTPGSMFEQNSPTIPTAPIAVGGNNTSFYFYNNQLVEQGKTAFQRKWGNRKQEDNWRRQNKQVSIFGENQTSTPENKENEGVQSAEKKEELAREDDPHNVEYYLKQIPFTAEALKKSNEIIEDAYFNSGLIYKDKLDNYQMAIDAFDKDLQRFPNTPNKEEIYYQLFLIYLRLGNKEMTETYRRLLLNQFGDNDYAATLRSANYEWNLRNIYKIQDQLYQQTYDAYLAGNINQVRENYTSITEKYPLSDLMPKFMYLNALTYAQSKDPEKLKETLTQLVEKYPKSEVTPVASEMLKGLLAGRVLSSDSSLARGMIWDMKFTNSQDTTGAAGVDFIAKAETEYLLLFIYPSQSVDKNQLIYDIADYNFSKFVYKTFDLSFNEVNNLDLLQVRGFDSLKDITDYIDLAFEKGSLMDHLDPSIITVPISADNYIALMNGKSLNEYFKFFEKNYTREMVKLVLLWNKQRSKSKEEIKPLESQKEEPIKVKNNIVESESVISIEQPSDSIITTDSIPTRIEFINKQDDTTKTDTLNTEIGVGDILSDDVINKADNVINRTVDIISNPVDGLRNLIGSSKDESEMTKEEKQALKEAQKEEREKEKNRKAEEKARKKAEEDALKALEKEDAERVKTYNDSVKNAQKLKEEEQRALLEAKKDEVKQKEQQRKDAQKEREQELKQREQERKDRLKQREQERKEQLKQREEERKQREKERESQLKQREQERKEIQKKREEERKERERQREEERKEKERLAKQKRS